MHPLELCYCNLLLRIPLFFQMTHALVASGCANKPPIDVIGSSSSSSHSCIQPSLGSVGCRWSSSPPCLGRYLQRHRVCVVPFNSVPSSLLSMYELRRRSVTIRGGDQLGVNLALVSYELSSFES